LVGLKTFDIILLIIYALVCIVIGIVSSRNQKGEDFLIAGRKMGFWGFLFSVVASYIGGAAIVAYTAYVYKFGISAITVFGGTAIGFLVFIPYAKKLRRISTKQKFHTLSDWFYFKFNKRVGWLSGIILFVVYFGMLLNQFIAGSSILAGISGWSYETALLISSLVIGIYLFAGGFSSVIKTDIFQYIVLFVLFVFMGYILSLDEQPLIMKHDWIDRADPFMSIVFLAFGIFIIFQSSEYWQRVYAAKNMKVVTRGLIWSAILVVITGFAITLIGLAANHHFGAIEARESFAMGLKILVPQKFHSVVLILIFAAIMSSADTQIFVLASSASKDILARFSRKSDSDFLMKRTRLFIAIFTLSAFGFAWFFRDLVQIFVFITGLGFTIIPAAIASFHFKLNNNAVFISFVSGLIYVLALAITGNMDAELSIASILVAFFALLFSQLFIKYFLKKS